MTRNRSIVEDPEGGGSLYLTRKSVKCRDGQFHINKLQVLAEAIQRGSRVRSDEEGHGVVENGAKQGEMEFLAGSGDHGDNHLPEYH